MPGLTKTTIPWATAVWNPVTGCTPAGDGCLNCYAKRMAETRLAGRAGYPPMPDSFRPTVHPDRIFSPMRSRKPQRIFVDSMGDLFHDTVPSRDIVRIFDVMRRAHRHKFIILTKRPERTREFVTTALVKELCFYRLPNVALGVSVWNQHSADRFAPVLRNTLAVCRIISAEPLLGPVTLDLTGISWVMCGGETGPGARPCHAEWIYDVSRQCAEAGVPYFWKQWGAVSDTHVHALGNLYAERREYPAAMFLPGERP